MEVRRTACGVPGGHDLPAERIALYVAAPERSSAPRAWLAVVDYDRDEATLLFHAPVGDEFKASTVELISAAIGDARTFGVGSLLAHWRGGWGSATDVLVRSGFSETAPGMWRFSVG